MKISRLKMSRKSLEYRVNQFFLKFLKNEIGKNINRIVSVLEYYMELELQAQNSSSVKSIEEELNINNTFIFSNDLLQ